MNKRIPRKKGQPANSKKHSDLYTDENPKGTIHGLGFKDVATAKASVAIIKSSGKTHAHKIQAAIAMEQRARVMGKTAEAAVYRKYINAMKKRTKKMEEDGPCWDTHKQVGMKKKGNRLVPNCVPKEDVPANSTASIPNPADTAMGPKYKAKTIHDRRKKKGDPLLLKRFRDYYNDKGIM